jgi:hypothetical protein
VCLVGTARADAALTIESPVGSTTTKTPSFSGSGASAGTFAVHIFKAGNATLVAEATATSAGGTWSSGGASPALEDGTYEAVAIEGLEVTENPVTFTVETLAPPAPTVELNGPTSSSSATPTFTGKASGTKPVVIGIYTATSEEVAQATTTGGGTWTSGSSSPALKNGEYFAVAEEPSELGGLSGVSSVVAFTIAVAAPTVTITQPTTPSNNTVPSFSGTATETTKVTVDVYAGATATGTVVATATATPSSKSWTSSKVSALKEGEYTAVASQPSSITGDPEGKSSAVTFKVVLEAPTMTLNPPSEVSGDTTPTFSGTSNETTTVTVDIYSGTTATGSIISKATATPKAGSWTSGASSPALKNGKYTAVATQPSSLTGNPEGKSSPATFEIETGAPTLAMSAPSKRSNNPEPTFSGTTSDNGKPVSVKIYAGSTTNGSLVTSATATPKEGKWTTGKASPALGSGEYTAQAQQESSIVGDEHKIGLSAADSFTIDTTPLETVQTTVQTLQPQAPTASFAWFPTSPHINEPVALVSGSTDPSSAITAFAWDLAGNGKFASGSAVISTSFATAGNHIVHLLVTDANNLSSVATETIPVTLAGPVLMQPFPIVQIISSDTEYGVRLGLLRVQAPVGARITVVCRGRGCPVKAEHAIAAGSKGAVSGRVQFRRYERALRAGVTLEIRVFKAGEIGKFTRFVVRRGRLPLRTDTCLNPAGTNTMTCPS